MTPQTDRYLPLVLLFTRVVVGYLFALHGTAKFFEFPLSMTQGNGSVALFSLSGLAALLELVGGPLIMFGLFTRATAFVLTGMMAYAYFFVHATLPTLLLPMLNKGELAVMYCMFFLLLMCTGAGSYSLDAKWCKRG